MSLAPIDPPLGVFPQYYAGRPTTLVLKEKILSLSGDDFGIKDTDGNVVVRCEGKFMSLRDRKVITDTQGNVLMNIKKKLATIHATYVGEDPNGNEIFRVKSAWSFKTKLKANFFNFTTKQDTALSIRGGFFAHHADLTIGEDGNGPPVARIDRKIFSKSEWGGKQTYHLSVAPGVDLALMAAICICFDEIQHEKDSGGE